MSSIYFHQKNGIYYFNVMINGVQYHRSSRQTTKSGAKVVAEQFVQDQMLANSIARNPSLQPPPPPPPAITLKVLAEKWEDAQDEETSLGHLRNVRDHVRLHLKNLHFTPIDQIGIEQIQPEVKAYRRSHTVPSTNGLRRTINLLFSFARKAKYVTELPFEPLSKRREPRKKRTSLTDDQYADLTDQLRKRRNPHVALMVVVIAGTGVRRSDVIQMVWADVDLVAGTWSPEIIKDGDTPFFTLDEWVIGELRKFDRIGPYVFSSPSGAPHGKEFLRRALRNGGKAIGVGPLSPHVLRAGFITYLANQGVPPTTIARIVGHSDVRVTQGYIIHTKQSLDQGMVVAQAIARAATARLAPKPDHPVPPTPPDSVGTEEGS